MNLIDKWINKNKNVKVVAILLGVAGLIFIITFILWELLFSKYYLFNQKENIFLDAVKEYYQYRPELLPDKGEIREITLEKMFLEDRIEALYAPNTKDICDTNSWVRVYHNENGEYQYYVYLKCGKYESSIDHEGPKVELNGEKEIIVNYGQAYTELGVKSVVDNKDGKIDINKVEIDNSSINTNQVGSYKVTYKIRDSLNNQTKVTRTVYVAKNLTEIVKQQTDDSNYYKGAVNNNYLLFSGMLFRIVNVNSDGTVKLISEDLVSNLRYDTDKYKGSNVEEWLNKVFYPSLTNTDKYVVDTKFCVSNVNSISDVASACNDTVTAKVGLLSIDEFYKTVSNGNSSIHFQNNRNSLLANKLGADNLCSAGGTIVQRNYLLLPPIRPVITIKSNLYITTGNGTRENPYKLNDYTYGKEHDKINTRIIGEYITFSGLDFRIIGKDSNGNIKVIGAEPIANTTAGGRELSVSINSIENYQYNLVDENNPGYILNEDYIEFLDYDKIITKKYNIITNEVNKKYTHYEKESVKAKVFLASTIELFSAVNNNPESAQRVQIFSDRLSGVNRVLMLNAMTGIIYELNTNELRSSVMKPVLYLNGNLKIQSGNGTFNSPYILK